ncbi:MAG: hypothetical protein LEGION0403_FIIPPAGN_02819 [Legionella sp.]
MIQMDHPLLPLWNKQATTSKEENGKSKRAHFVSRNLNSKRSLDGAQRIKVFILQINYQHHSKEKSPSATKFLR